MIVERFDRRLKISDDRGAIKNDHLQSEKLKNGPFCMLKFGPLKKKFQFVLSIFSAHPIWLFWTPKLWLGNKNEDFQQWLPSDQKWSFTVQKVEKMAFLYAKIRPFEEKISIFFPPIFSACPSWSICTPELWSGTKIGDFQRWSPIDQKWSFTVRKVEKSAFLRTNMRDFEKKNLNFFLAHLLCPSEQVVLHPRTLIGD